MNPGKYVVFSLGSLKFGLPIENIEQILTSRPFVRIPNTQEGVLGVFELRGETLPVIDTRLVLGLPEGDYGCFLVVSIKELGIRAAFVADQVDEIMTLSASEIDSCAETVPGAGETHMGRRGEALIYLLKIGTLVPGSPGAKLNNKLPKVAAA